MLRDEWSDEIPDVIVSSVDNIKTKARNQWYQSVVGWIEIAIEQGLFSQNVTDALDSFDQYCQQTNFHDRLKNEEDIRRGNELLEIALSAFK